MTSLQWVSEPPRFGNETEIMEFGPLTITFDGRVLRPRSWTKMQSEWAAELLRFAPSGPVLEVCAGVGHIGLLAVARQPRPLVQVDLNEAACTFARWNAAAARLSSPVEIRHGRMQDVLEDAEQFALIIADPPWVRSSETGVFPDDPLTAIDGGSDGLDVARTCLEVIDGHLDTAGSALLQLGSQVQIDAVEDHLREHTELRLEVVDFRSHASGNVVLRLARPRADRS